MEIRREYLSGTFPSLGSLRFPYKLYFVVFIKFSTLEMKPTKGISLGGKSSTIELYPGPFRNSSKAHEANQESSSCGFSHRSFFTSPCLCQTVCDILSHSKFEQRGNFHLIAKSHSGGTVWRTCTWETHLTKMSPCGEECMCRPSLVLGWRSAHDVSLGYSNTTYCIKEENLNARISEICLPETVYKIHEEI